MGGSEMGWAALAALAVLAGALVGAGAGAGAAAAEAAASWWSGATAGGGGEAVDFGEGGSCELAGDRIDWMRIIPTGTARTSADGERARGR